ncbi:MAG: Uma2 family endonuclease [Phormidesmis sp. CAN_BIN44]|nr:Uma2 family endonuclease [Phormidesmis sp. CAN_BIN44]
MSQTNLIGESPTPTLKKWSVEDYHRIIECGILTPADQVELLEGVIVQSNPQRSPHAATTKCASDYLREMLRGQVIARVQLPITLPPDSEPEPDIAIVRLERRKYFDRHPQPDDILFLAEVADSTLNEDRTRKAKLYAKANICEYWVIDVNKRQVLGFRRSNGDRYSEEFTLSENDSIELVAFPGIVFSMSQLFP